MKLLSTLAVLAITLFSCVQAQNSSEILQQALQTLPKCALQCFTAAISQSTCELTDIYCIAHNKELNDGMTKCVKSACTIRESLTAKNFSETAFGGEVRDQTKVVSYISLIAGGIAVLAFILRLIARLPCFGGIWGWDDYAVVVAMLPTLPLTALSVVLANDGLGKDMWTLPFENITRILHVYYFSEIFYLSAIPLTKISVLLFYLRIFPEPGFRRAVYITMAISALYIMGLIPATIFQCLPIRIAWERWDGEHHGKCISLNLEGWVSAVINIVLDLVVLCLPLRELSKLAMSRRKKAGIMLMFVGGGFVTVVSVLRLRWLIQFANTENISWDYTPVGYWSTLEVHVSIIFACFPALRSLQHRLFPSTKLPTSYYERQNYGFNSKGGSPFPSAKKGAPDTKPTTLASQASILRSRGRMKGDKEFIQLEEYEMKAGSELKKDHKIGRGQTNTQVERGSIHNEDATRAFYHTSSPVSSPLTLDFTLQRFADVITVRKEYSVNVEYQSRTPGASPPRSSQDDTVTTTSEHEVTPQSSRRFSLKRSYN